MATMTLKYINDVLANVWENDAMFYLIDMFEAEGSQSHSPPLVVWCNRGPQEKSEYVTCMSDVPKMQNVVLVKMRHVSKYQVKIGILQYKSASTRIQCPTFDSWSTLSVLLADRIDGVMETVTHITSDEKEFDFFKDTSYEGDDTLVYVRNVLIENDCKDWISRHDIDNGLFYIFDVPADADVYVSRGKAVSGFMQHRAACDPLTLVICVRIVSCDEIVYGFCLGTEGQRDPKLKMRIAHERLVKRPRKCCMPRCEKRSSFVASVVWYGHGQRLPAKIDMKTNTVVPPISHVTHFWQQLELDAKSVATVDYHEQQEGFTKMLCRIEFVLRTNSTGKVLVIYVASIWHKDKKDRGLTDIDACRRMLASMCERRRMDNLWMIQEASKKLLHAKNADDFQKVLVKFVRVHGVCNKRIYCQNRIEKTSMIPAPTILTMEHLLRVE
jgi:hypothetical protein